MWAGDFALPNLCVIPARALEDKSLKRNDFLALLAAGYYANHAGKGVWASKTTMAERVGMTRDEMRASLRTLEDRGYLHRDRTTGAIDVLLDGPRMDRTTPAPEPEPEPERERTGFPLPDLPVQYRAALSRVLTASSYPAGVLAELEAMANGMRGKIYSWETIGQALHEMQLASVRFSARALRSFCEGLSEAERGQRPFGRGTDTPVDFEALRRQMEES